jgi:solute carrier family 25 oxoglutarate transporter 11
LIGGLSGMAATSCIQPIDTVKVRIQLRGEEAGMAKSSGAAFEKTSLSPFSVIKEILKNDGLKGFYKGLDSALLRQILYATVRLGLFRSISDSLKEKKKRNLTLFEKSAASLFAGFVGAMCGNPADLVLVRFQADSMSPINERRNYKNVFDALRRITNEEGVLALWRGSFPTVLRAMSMNLGMLATYDEVKERLNAMSGTIDTYTTRLAASAISGVVCSFMSLPFDNVKTKLQRMKAKEGVYP